MCTIQGYRAFCVPNTSLFPQWHDVEICWCSVSLNCWVSYLCATPNFGKIGSQAATPPSLPRLREKNYFHETVIIKLNKDLHFSYILPLVEDALTRIDPFQIYTLTWLRSCHAINVWRQSTVQHIYGIMKHSIILTCVCDCAFTVHLCSWKSKF